MTIKMIFPTPSPLIRMLRLLADRLESGHLILDKEITFSSVTADQLNGQVTDSSDMRYSFDLYLTRIAKE